MWKTRVRVLFLSRKAELVQQIPGNQGYFGLFAIAILVVRCRVQKFFQFNQQLCWNFDWHERTLSVRNAERSYWPWHRLANKYDLLGFLVYHTNQLMRRAISAITNSHRRTYVMPPWARRTWINLPVFPQSSHYLLDSSHCYVLLSLVKGRCISQKLRY